MNISLMTSHPHLTLGFRCFQPSSGRSRSDLPTEQKGMERPPASSRAVVPARMIRSDMESDGPNVSLTGSSRSRPAWRFLLTDQSLPGENLVRGTLHRGRC